MDIRQAVDLFIHCQHYHTLTVPDSHDTWLAPILQAVPSKLESPWPRDSSDSGAAAGPRGGAPRQDSDAGLHRRLSRRPVAVTVTAVARRWQNHSASLAQAGGGGAQRRAAAGVIRGGAGESVVTD